MQHWEFTIYKHSKGRYDPDEMFFWGAEEVVAPFNGGGGCSLVVLHVESRIATAPILSKVAWIWLQRLQRVDCTLYGIA